MSEQLKLNIGDISISGEVEASFRPIHYLGSKMMLVSQIREAAFNVAPTAQRFCDLFSGSATLSYAMSRSYDVTSVDVQEYARVLAASLLSAVRPTVEFVDNFVDEITSGTHMAELNQIFSDAILFEKVALQTALKGSTEDIVTVLEHGSIKYASELPHYAQRTRERMTSAGMFDSPKLSISSVYGGIYFSYQQSIAIDSIRVHIEKVQESGLKEILLAALVTTVSNSVNTIGKQFAQPIRLLAKDGKVKTNLISKIINDRSVDVLAAYRHSLKKYGSLPAHETNGRALKGDYYDVLNTLHENNYGFDIIYADPPYTRDHYSRYYHLIETLCLMDSPNLSLTKSKGKTSVSRGLYREDRHQSSFCIKSQAPEAFNNLFGVAAKFDCPLLISYSPFCKDNDDHPRLMDIATIVEIGMSHYRDSKVSYFDSFSHSKLNSVGNNKSRVQEAEVLLTFIP